MANTILLKGRGIRVEAQAAGAITPGHLVMINSAGKLVVHSTASGQAAKIFAVENDLLGLEITDAYATNDYVQAENLYSGCEVYGLIADGEDVGIGDLLESDGAGGFQALTAAAQGGTDPFAYTPEGSAIAVALEAVDNDTGSQARIKVRLL